MDKIVCCAGAITTIVSILACIYVACGKRGKVVINSNGGDKPWDMISWIAGIFVAGMGVALITNVPGDLAGYINMGFTPVESIGMINCLNGIPVWALYSILGLWYTKHMDSKIGKVAAMLSTILGMAISLWTGTNAIVRMIGLDVPYLKLVFAAVMVIVAIISAKTNFLKKMSKFASALLGICALALLATDVGAFTSAPITGGITAEFWKEYFFGATAGSWWFWWISWAPTVGRWLAHISQGKSVRQYVVGTVLVPSIVIVLWSILCWNYSDVINALNVFTTPSTMIISVLFIITGMIFMSGTLDSDCKVFTEDLESLTKGKLKQDTMIPWYGIFVLFLFSFFVSGLIKNPWGFNMYSSLIFIPLFIWAFVDCIKSKNN